MHLREIHLVTGDLEESVKFYTQTLGLKEIERSPDTVALQGKDISGCLILGKGEIDDGFDSIHFEVDNLYSTIQKLEAEGVDVDLEDSILEGYLYASFNGPDNVKIGLLGLDQAISDEEIESPDENTETPSIGEKVRFWEEQDRINQELIPRVIRQNELLTQHIAEHDNLQQIFSDTMQKALSEQAQQYESALDTAQKQLNETHEQITQKALSEQVENLRQEARQTRNRLTAIAAGSAIIAITALIVAVLF